MSSAYATAGLGRDLEQLAASEVRQLLLELCAEDSLLRSKVKRRVKATLDGNGPTGMPAGGTPPSGRKRRSNRGREATVDDDRDGEFPASLTNAGAT